DLTGPGAQFYGVGGAPIAGQDGSTIRLEPSGAVTVLTGVTDQGQGTRTALAQIVADELGVPLEAVAVLSGDTGMVPYGGGTWASRGMPIGGSATLLAVRALRDRVRRAVVEVDPETGRVRVVRYVAVDDCGTLVNPALVDGQVRGGVAQGIGGALWEHCVYDDTGQLLTTTLMDYAVPTAADLPPIDVHHLETPAPSIAGGYKGAGEGGTAGAPAAILNAVNDALAPFGAMVTDQPVTPERVLRALGRLRRA